ncbi:MAG: NUDIX hydrolase [Fidelibacterota bacterium]
MTVPRFIRALQARLSGPLPGREAQERMAPVPRSSLPQRRPEEEAVPSAVLILLFEKDSEWFFVLTERTTRVEHHQGQVSLPGGAQEKGESSEQTALRETEEELGIPPEGISIIGELSPLFIAASGFRVHPVVGWSDGEPEITPDPVEVGSVHFASVAQLMDRATIRREVRQIRGKKVDVPFFQFDTVQVWGATAVILAEFREVLMSSEAKSRRLLSGRMK